MDYIVNNEDKIRLISFISFLILFFLVELFFSKFKRNKITYKRWFINFAFIFIDNILLRILFPILAVGLAMICNKNNIGIFNILNIPIIIEFILTFIILDFGIWLQHLTFHKVKFLWNFHKIHHSDEEVDFTTGIRFHPGEIIISMLYKMFLVVLIGPSIALIIIFEVILNATSLFNHSNINIQYYLDNYLRKIIVTPNMHRIHHSVKERETNSNFGFNFSIWDKLFGTYIDKPKFSEKFVLGLNEFNNSTKKGLLFLLINPFHK